MVLVKNIISKIENIDIASFLFVSDKSNYSSLHAVAYCLSVFGNGYFYIFALPFIIFLLSPVKGVSIFAVCVVSVFFEKILYMTLKRWFKRARPPVRLESVTEIVRPPDEFSFPSGHSSTAFCLAVVMSHYFHQMCVEFFAIAGLIAVSRVVLRAHFPLDVIVGSLLGSSVACIVLTFLS